MMITHSWQRRNLKSMLWDELLFLECSRRPSFAALCWHWECRTVACSAAVSISKQTTSPPGDASMRGEAVQAFGQMEKSVREQQATVPVAMFQDAPVRTEAVWAFKQRDKSVQKQHAHRYSHTQLQAQAVLGFPWTWSTRKVGGRSCALC